MSETIEAAHLPRFQFPPDGKKAKILEIIEKIRHCDLEQDIDVPELVLCGQQSSGKSSVLEALTGLEFPKGDGGACTRFPIEYVISMYTGLYIDSGLLPDTCTLGYASFLERKPLI